MNKSTGFLLLCLMVLTACGETNDTVESAVEEPPNVLFLAKDDLNKLPGSREPTPAGGTARDVSAKH